MTAELPITPAKLKVPRVVRAYCNKCKTVMDQIIYNHSGSLYVVCPGCKSDLYAGNRGILAFENLTCKTCGRETLWAVYCHSGEIYVLCLGCGREIYAGNRCPL